MIIEDPKKPKDKSDKLKEKKKKKQIAHAIWEISDFLIMCCVQESTTL